MIELVDVSKRFAGSFAVQHVSLSIAAGELVAVLGESGSGKTTLVKMVNRLVDPDDGEVRVDGRDVRTQDAVSLRRTIGYVIQQAGLFPHLTIAENVAVVPRLLDWEHDEIDKRVDELLALVELAPAAYRDRFPEQIFRWLYSVLFVRLEKSKSDVGLGYIVVQSPGLCGSFG